MPPEVDQYQRCRWRGEDMSLLEFLRKSNGSGGVAGYLKFRYNDLVKKEYAKLSADDRQATSLAFFRRDYGRSVLSLRRFAREYTVRGKKLVACEMLSRLLA
eukprot:12929363-Prorocentrum_lima.AAC.1